MKILFAGHNERGKACFDAIIKSRHEMVGCLAIQSKETGYYEGLGNRAMAANIHCYMQEEINAPFFVNRLKELGADIMVMAGYPRLVGRGLIDAFPKGVINLHASPLPGYRGCAPLNWALINGERAWAISFIQVDEGIDTGDILLQHKFEIDMNETIWDVVQRVNRLYPQHLMKLLDQIEEGRETYIKQDRSQGSYYGRRYPRDGKICWRDMDGLQVHNLVRALTRPYPGAFTYHKNEQRNIWKTSFVAPTHISAPGRVIRKSDQGIIVMCKDFGILISDMDGMDKIKIGDDLG